MRVLKFQDQYPKISPLDKNLETKFNIFLLENLYSRPGNPKYDRTNGLFDTITTTLTNTRNDRTGKKSSFLFLIYCKISVRSSKTDEKQYCLNYKVMAVFNN